jgi:site-specific recombinase XerD
MLKGIEERSGVENVHPHRFRRTLATNLINRGMPIQEVAAILGHDKLDTTMKYVYIDSKNLKTAYQKYA